LLCNIPIKLYDKREPNCFVIFQYNHMTNENQIILIDLIDWYLTSTLAVFQLYSGPNYFVIFQ